MIRIEHGKAVRYVPDAYVRIYYDMQKVRLHSSEGTETALQTMLNANPHLRQHIQRIEFLDRIAWKKVA